MEVRQGNLKDVLDVARLAIVLWPEHSLHAMALEILESIQGKYAAYFLAVLNHEIIGLAYVKLRQETSDGGSGESLVHLEGLFLKEEYRQQEHLMKLITACEEWAGIQENKKLKSEFNWRIPGEKPTYRYTRLNDGVYGR